MQLPRDRGGRIDRHQRACPIDDFGSREAAIGDRSDEPRMIARL
jgi:hypothetical protein